MPSASTTAHPTFVTIALTGMRWRDYAQNQKFGKVEYFWAGGWTCGLGVLPVGQRKGL